MNAITTTDFRQTTRKDADEAHERLKINALVQLEMLREDMFLDVSDPSASFKEKLAYAEHLVKSTPIESEMKKAEGAGNAFQFAFQFQSPGGEIQTVGATIDVTPQVVDPVSEAQIVSLDSEEGAEQKESAFVDFGEPGTLWEDFASIEMEGE